MVELFWDGKRKHDRRVGPVRIPLPFQTIETVNESTNERQRTLALSGPQRAAAWRNRLIWGDKKYVLPSLLAEFAGAVDLIYIDPPFDTGSDFTAKARIPHSDKTIVRAPTVLETKAYRDTWAVTEDERQRGVTSIDKYLRWFSDTAVLLKELLSARGLLFVHLDDNVVHEAKVLLDELFGRDKFRGEIVWQLGTGAKSKTFFSIQHNVILVYSAGDEWTFNDDDPAAREPYAAGSLKAHFTKVDASGRPYRSRVINGQEYIYYADAGRLRGSVWTDISSMKANSPVMAEATGYPTQKPEELLQRIIGVCSRPGDLVLDCFCGSGTTLAVAEKLGRRWIGCDLGRFAVHTTRKRLLDNPNVSPFLIQNLGKYERQAWLASEFDDPATAAARDTAYKDFVVELYRGRPLHGNAWLHGAKNNRVIHVGAVDAPVTADDIASLVVEVRRRAGPVPAGKTTGVDVLGWDFAFEVVETAKHVAQQSGVDLSFRRIPREILDQRAVDQGDIQEKDFFELRAFLTDLTVVGRTATLKLTELIVPAEDLPEEVASAINHWSQWIDYWAIDWDYQGDTFHNSWQSFRASQKPDLELAARHEFQAPGRYTIVVKVIDLLGADTTRMLTLEVT
jgi:adenine-specific DNA-methyltransferase